MRTNILFWLTFALIALDVNAILDSQGTSGTITKLLPQINTDPSANGKVNQVDIGNGNENNNDKSHQSQHTGKYEDQMQLGMNGQQNPHPASKVLSKANSPGSSNAVLGLVKRRFMRRGGNTTPAQQPDLLTKTFGRKLVTVDASRQVSVFKLYLGKALVSSHCCELLLTLYYLFQETSNPDQKSKNASGQQPGAVDTLLGKQAFQLGDSNSAQQDSKQGEQPAVLAVTPGGPVIGTVNPPKNVPGPVDFSPQQPKKKSEA